jgi:hypothetical protein
MPSSHPRPAPRHPSRAPAAKTRKNSTGNTSPQRVIVPNSAMCSPMAAMKPARACNGAMRRHSSGSATRTKTGTASQEPPSSARVLIRKSALRTANTAVSSTSIRVMSRFSDVMERSISGS